jgi:hypothetical protein
MSALVLPVRVLRKCYVAGKLVEADQVVTLDARAAIDLVESGRGEPVDAAAFRHACKFVTTQSLRAAGPVPVNGAAPWPRR